MAQAELVPLDKIVEHIKELCSQRRTGTLFLASDDNRLSRVVFDQGDIVSLFNRNRRGMEALAHLGEIRQARLRFDDTVVSCTENENLSAKVILDFLKAAAMRASPQTAQRDPAAASFVLSADAKSAIQQSLAKYIGPMAEIVFEDSLEQAVDARSLALSLIREIADAGQAAQFGAELDKILKL